MMDFQPQPHLQYFRRPRTTLQTQTCRRPEPTLDHLLVETSSKSDFGLYDALGTMAYLLLTVH